MKFLVTGAAGFIGTHLCRHLRESGHEVVEVDRNQPQAGEDSYREVIDLAGHGIYHSLAYHKPDRVIHLAAQVGREFGEDDVRHTVTSNAEITAVVARNCGELGVPLTYCSSSEIYGDHGARTVREYTEWLLPHNLYGLTKRWGEEVCWLYAPEKLQIVRLSMPYGPGAPPGRGRRAMDNMLWQAHHCMPITVHKGAERSWCWIGDTVEGFRLVAESNYSGAWNLGRDDNPISMKAIAQWSCALAGAPLDLIEEVEAPGRQTVVKRLLTDRIRDLGWEPKVELAEGMPQVYEWVKKFDKDGNYVG